MKSKDSVRMRDISSNRYVEQDISNGRKDQLNHDSLGWLAENYIIKKGLRNWTWKVIIEGIIEEHMRSLVRDSNKEMNKDQISLLWLTFLNTAGISDLKKVPNTSDPNHQDVKTIMFIYSMETFLYTRLNKIQRDKDTSSILTLGPFAVALTRIIDKAKRNKKDQIKGEFTTYRGISLI
jgi:hypothetical protein